MAGGGAGNLSCPYKLGVGRNPNRDVNHLGPGLDANIKHMRRRRRKSFALFQFWPTPSD